MTRETKLGLVVAGSFLALVGGVVAVRLKQADGPPAEAEVVAAEPAETPAAAPPAEEPERRDVSAAALAMADKTRMPAAPAVVQPAVVTPPDPKPEPTPPPAPTAPVMAPPPAPPEPKPEPKPEPTPPPPVPEVKPDPKAEPPAPPSAPAFPDSSPAPAAVPPPTPMAPMVPEPPAPAAAAVVTPPPPVTEPPAPTPPAPAPTAPVSPAPVTPAPIPDPPPPPAPSPSAFSPPVADASISPKPAAEAPKPVTEPPAPPPPLNPNVANTAAPTVTVIPAGGNPSGAALDPPRGGVAPPPGRDPFTAPGRRVPPPEPKKDSYIEETHRWTPGDSFAAMSKRFYNDDRYADALLKYNQDYPLATREMRQNPPAIAPGQTLWVPPARILERDYGHLLGGLTPVTPTSRPAVEPVAPPPGLANSGFRTADPQLYRVKQPGESLQEIARRTLGNSVQAGRVQMLNPTLSPDPRLPIPAGTVLRLPAEAKVDAADRP